MEVCCIHLVNVTSFPFRVYWCFTSHATIFQLYMWRHRWSGGVKKKLCLRSGSLTCPSYTDTGPPFLYDYAEKSPHLVAFNDTLGIRRTYTHFRSNPVVVPNDIHVHGYIYCRQVIFDKARHGNSLFPPSSTHSSLTDCKICNRQLGISGNDTNFTCMIIRGIEMLMTKIIHTLITERNCKFPIKYFTG